MYKSRIVAILLLLSINLLGQNDYGFLPPVYHAEGSQLRSSMCVANPSTDIPWDRTRSFADQVNDAIDGENRLFGTSFGNYVHPRYDPTDPLDISSKVLAELRRVYGMDEIDIEHDESLIDLAANHSCAMDIDDTFCHTCPSDGTLSARVNARIGTRCFQYISENIAWITTEDIELSILRVIYLMFYADVACCDNGHRDNFLNCNYNENTKIGFGIIRGDLQASNGAFFDAWIMTWDYLTYWSYPDCGDCNCGVSIGTPLCEATMGVVLPIDLLEFEVSQSSCDNVTVSWTTASEIDNDYFTLQRSADGTSWSDIQIINGAGNSDEPNNYSHTDVISNIDASVIYYRLMQTDLNGDNTIFDVVSTENNCNDLGLAIHPNPTTSFITISSEQEVTKVEIFSVDGRMISDNIQLDNNRINVESLRSGVYLLAITTKDNQSRVRKIIKE